MATAPNPKKLAQVRRDNQAARLVWKITVRGDEKILRRADIGPADARLVRQATGDRLVDIVAQTLTGKADMDCVAVLWWLARRHDGERLLSYEVAEAELPSYEDITNDQELVQFVLDVTEDDETEDGSPEA